MANSLRWGFMGLGGISVSSLSDFRIAGINVVAVGSRSESKAKEYASEHSVARHYGSYQDLVADKELDVVYIATTHNAHFENTKLALAAGKHVLLEKPFTLNAAQAIELVSLAREKGLFLMEAMWTRFLPSHRTLFEKLHEGIIGDPLYLIADHNQYIPKERAARLHDPELGGGSLIDLAVYPISFSQRIFGTPESIQAAASLMSGDIDESVATIFSYSSGRQAVTHSSLRVAGPVRAFVLGTKGRVEMDKPFYEQSSFNVYDNTDKLLYSYQDKIEGRGLQYQALEVESCIAAGKTESSIMSLDDTIAVMKIMDEIRSQTGIKYPGI